MCVQSIGHTDWFLLKDIEKASADVVLC
jgi:hypothetical protein